ncbi:MAG: galactose ABC transporter substrate-binding protein [Acetivibrio sp.]
MKKMKKTICLILCFCIGISLAACETPKEEKKGNKIKSIRIGISVYDYYDTFISELMDAFDIYVKSMETNKGITISVDLENAAASQSVQNAQVEDFISNGCDVICVNLVDRTDPTMIIDKAKSANIPVVFFNRELVEEDLERWNKLYYVGAVALESGIMEGKLVVDACKKEWNQIDKNGDGTLQYVMLEGEAGHQDSIVRTEYSVNTVAEAGYDVEKLAYAIANWNRAQAQTKTAQWIEQLGERIEVIFSNNDDMALGAVDAYKSADIAYDKFPVIVGIDGTKAGMEAVKEGTMKGTVLNDENGQAKAMVELCYSLVTGEKLIDNIHLEDGKYIRLPHKMVTQENLEELQKNETHNPNSIG